MLVQEHIPGPGEDLKVYVVGDQVFAVRKPFSETSFAVPGRPVRVDAEVRALALRAGRALGLGLFGLDVIESPDGPVVVDANYFPGYKGVPDAGRLIGEYIDAARPAPRARRAGRGGLSRACASARANPERVLLAIVAEGFLSRLSFGVINVALPLYADRQLGMSTGQIGLLISLNTMVALLFKPVMGALADRFGLKRSLNVSVLLRSAVTLLLAVGDRPVAALRRPLRARPVHLAARPRDRRAHRRARRQEADRPDLRLVPDRQERRGQRRQGAWPRC